MNTFIDELRNIKPVGLGKKKAIKSPLVVSEITSKVKDVGFREAEYFDIVMKLGMHSTLRFPNEPEEARVEIVHAARRAIADLVYRDVKHGLNLLLSDIYRVDNHELRRSMEVTVSDIFAAIEI